MQQRSPPASWQKDSEQTQGSDPLSPTSACKTASGVCLVHQESSGLSPVDGHQDSQGVAEHDIEGQPERTTPLQLGEEKTQARLYSSAYMTKGYREDGSFLGDAW